MRGSVESPFEAQLHETVVIGLNTGGGFPETPLAKFEFEIRILLISL